MRLKRLTAAMAAASLMVAPTMVTAQSSAAPAPQVEVVNGGSELVDRAPAAFPWIPVAGAVLAAFLLWLILENDDDEDVPTSP